MPTQPYQDLWELSKKIHTLGSVLSLLRWDQETYMPMGGITPRAEQIALLAEEIHRRKIGSSFRTKLVKLIHLSSGKIREKGLSKPEVVAVKEWRREFLRSTKLSANFVKEFAQATSEACQVWTLAKRENRFELFAPFLQKIVHLNQKKADTFGFEHHPYDALLESYEPCVTTRRLEGLFEGLQKQLQKLLRDIEPRESPSQACLQGTFGEEAQWALGQRLMAILPLEHQHVRLDRSSHPFSTSLHPLDHRITSRTLPNNLLSHLFSVLHESGHALYEMGLPAAHYGTPLAETVSLSIHESQSRWWETLIGRSYPFWQFFYPTVQEIFPKEFKNVSLQTFYAAMHHVSPSFIRVEADEVTYNLHVILRFTMEKALISGELKVIDLPDAWNAKSRELLGIVPPTNREGCLQDIHWACGDFGYFPTYALGNLFAAHFFTAFAKEHPDWEREVSVGNFMFIRDWLKRNIHQWGRTYSADELAMKVTGKKLTEAAYCRYLKQKYTAL